MDDNTETYLSYLPISDANALESIGYFTAPASSSHHLAERGGLVKHSTNVTRWLLRLTEALDVDWPRFESPYIVGMLHDIVKTKCYKICTAEDTGKDRILYVSPKPYSGHGSASAIIAQTELGMRLLPAEAAAIIHHMGAFVLDQEELVELNQAMAMFPKEIIATHTADMLATKCDEAEEAGHDE